MKCFIYLDGSCVNRVSKLCKWWLNAAKECVRMQFQKVKEILIFTQTNWYQLFRWWFGFISSITVDIWICVIFSYSFLVRFLYGRFIRLVNQCSYFVLLKFLTKFHHRQPKITVNVNILSCFVYTEKKELSIRLNLNEVCYCNFSSREHKSVNFCYTWIVYCSQALKIHV